MIDLVYAWVAGVGILIGIFVIILGLGYLTRQVVPVEDWGSPLKTPLYEFDGMDIAASLVVGFIVTIIIIVPLTIGAVFVL